VSVAQAGQGDDEDAVIATVGGGSSGKHRKKGRLAHSVQVHAITQTTQVGSSIVKLPGTELHLDRRPPSVGEDDDGVRLQPVLSR